MVVAARYLFDGDVTDSSGFGNDLSGGSPTYESGLIGQALTCDGTTLTTPIEGALRSVFTGTSGTIAVRWKQNQTTDDWEDVIAYSTAEGEIRIERNNRDDAPSVWINYGTNHGDGNQGFLMGGVLPVDNGEWFTLVIRRQPNKADAWINGEHWMENTGSQTETPMTPPTGSLKFNEEVSEGSIDEAVFDTEAWSVQEIREFAFGKCGHWPLDAVSDGETAYDVSGHNRHGVSSGTATGAQASVGESATEFVQSNSSYVETSEPIPIGSNGFSIAFRIYPYTINETSDTNDYRGLIGADSSNNMILVEQSKSLTFREPDDSRGFTGSGSGPAGKLVEYEWNDVIATFNAETGLKQIYINGIDPTEHTVSVENPQDLGQLVFGNDIGRGESHALDGRICDVRLYANVVDSEFIERYFQNRASLSDTGSFMSMEIDEVENSYYDSSFKEGYTEHLVKSAQITTSEAHTGDQSIRAFAVGDSRWKTCWELQLSDKMPRPDPGETWTFGCWVKSNHSSQYQLGHMGGGGWLSIYSQPNADWTYYETTDKVPNTVGTFDFGLRGEGSLDGEIFIDDVYYAPGHSPRYEDTEFSIENTGVTRTHSLNELATGQTPQMRQTQVSDNLLPTDDAYGRAWNGSGYFGSTVSVDDSKAYVGNSSIKVTTIAGDGHVNGFMSGSAGSVSAGEVVVGQVWTWIPSNRGVVFSFRTVDPNSEGHAKKIVDGTGSWQLIQIGPWTADQNYGSLMLQGTEEAPHADEEWSFWIDGLQILKADTHTAFGDEQLQAIEFSELN